MWLEILKSTWKYCDHIENYGYATRQRNTLFILGPRLFFVIDRHKEYSAPVINDE